MLSRCLRYGKGLRVGAVDILDWPSSYSGSNPLDLSTSAGMALLVIHVYSFIFGFPKLGFFQSKKIYIYIYIYTCIHSILFL